MIAYYKELLSTAKCYPALVRLIAPTHELSGSLRGATSRMRNTMALRHSCWIVAATHATSCTLCGATRITLQHRQILPRPWQMTFQDIRQDLANGWTVIYIRWSNRSHPPTSPNIAPATKNDVPKYPMSIWQTAKLSFTSCGASRITFNITKHCACHETGHSTISKKNFENGWNIIYIARSNPGHPPTSRYIAPAMQNDIPRYQKKSWQRAEPSFTPREATRVTLQLHQIFRLPRNRRFQDITKLYGNAEMSCTMRAGSENDPTMNPSQCNWGYFARSPRAFCLEKYNMWRSGYHLKFHQVMCLPQTVNYAKYHPCQENWMCNLNATSSNIAPATKSALVFDSLLFFDFAVLLLFFDSIILSL